MQKRKYKGVPLGTAEVTSCSTLKVTFLENNISECVKVQRCYFDGTASVTSWCTPIGTVFACFFLRVYYIFTIIRWLTPFTQMGHCWFRNNMLQEITGCRHMNATQPDLFYSNAPRCHSDGQLSKQLPFGWGSSIDFTVGSAVGHQ